MGIIRVYRITNKKSGKLYFGITHFSLAERWRYHVTASRKIKNRNYIANAIKAHGVENFTIQLVVEAVDRREACMIERGLIAQYGTLIPNGYNMTIGGEKGAVGNRHKPEAITQIGLSSKKNWQREKYRADHSSMMKKLWAPGTEYRKNMINKRRQMWSDDPDRRTEASARSKEMWNRRDQKAKDELGGRVRSSITDFWSSLPTEERVRRGQKVQATRRANFAALSSDEQQRIKSLRSQRQREGHLRYLEKVKSLPAEEQEAIRREQSRRVSVGKLRTRLLRET